MLTITVYTTGPSCGRCIATKRALDKSGIPYREVNIRDSDAAREDGTGEDHWSGFRPDQIKRVATAQNTAS